MSVLQCKTRGGSLPNGKAKVYFCCHPDDFGPFFEEISGDILEIANCAVYYRAEDGDPSQELSDFDLQQMDLFAVPVTTRLLTQPDAATERELAIARAANIPLLPFMTESGLDAAFEQQFGSIQYLDKYRRDDTAIPYQEKLKTFLEAVLTGDELAEKIRSAFDAYIFLSYRKKDRAVAQKLIRLIHENEFARDVAVWYDEFLTPGENFNDLIAQALEKSSLFVLAVTPNVVNEINYIMNIEYPLAVERGKPVAPVEMVPTDREELKRLYQGIPQPVAAEDAAGLAQILKDRLPAISLSGSADPKHLFFIGLAYLAGIDVEKDAARAVTLLKTAADAGLDEAMEKLTDIYYYGDGVAQDYGEALRWSQKLGDKYGEAAEASRQDADLAVLLKHRMKYGQLALDAKVYDEARKTYERAYEGAKTLAFGSVSRSPFGKVFGVAKKLTGRNEYFSDAVYAMTVCCRSLMDIYSEMGFVEKASEWGTKGANLAGTAADVLDDPRIRAELLKLYGRMGCLCLESGSLAGAEQWFAEEDGLVPDGTDFEARMAGVRVHSHYGDLAEAQGDLDHAVEYAETACKRCYALYEEYRDPYLLETALELLLTLSTRYEKTGKLNDAAGCLDELKETVDEVQQKGRQMSLDRFDSLMYFHRGSVLMQMGKGDPMAQMRQGLPYMEKQAEEAVDAKSTQDVVYAFLKLGDCLFAEGDYQEAAQRYEKAGTFITDTVAFTRSVRDTRTAAEVYEKLFDTWVRLGYGMVAKKWYDLALYMREAVALSTKKVADTAAYDALKKHRAILKGVYRAPKGVDCLIDVLTRTDEEVERDCASQGGWRQAMEAQLAERMKEFPQTHPNFAARYQIQELGEILAGKRTGDIDTLCSKAAQAIIKSYKPFLRYDEDANLIAAYCGHTELKNARRVIGGKEQALKDFASFFEDIPMLYYPLDQVKHAELWRLVYHDLSSEGVVKL